MCVLFASGILCVFKTRHTAVWRAMPVVVMIKLKGCRKLYINVTQI